MQASPGQCPENGCETWAPSSQFLTEKPNRLNARLSEPSTLAPMSNFSSVIQSGMLSGLRFMVQVQFANIALK